MTIFVYMLNFDDDTRYVGQTSNLNSRVNSHKMVFKSQYGLSITRVDVLAMYETSAEALAHESSVIEHIGLDNLRNKTVSSLARIDVNKEPDILPPNIQPMNPEDLADRIANIVPEDGKSLLEKKMLQLTNRYCRTFYEHQTMLENIKRMDDIIEEAVAKEFE